MSTASRLTINQASSSYLQVHFGAETKLLTAAARERADERDWKVAHEKDGKLGQLVRYVPNDTEQDRVMGEPVSVCLDSPKGGLEVADAFA